LPDLTALPGPLLAVLAAVVYTAGMAVAWKITHYDYEAEAARLIRSIIPVLVVLVALMLLTIRLTGLDVFGAPVWNWKVLVGFAPPVIAVAGLIVAVARRKDADWRLVAGVLLGTLLVGIGEEAAYRGIAFNGLAEHFSVPLAVLLSSVLFGLLHSVNVLAGLSRAAVVRQIVTTTLLGALIAWVYVFSGRNLVLVMAWHFLYDFSLIAAPPVSGKPNRIAVVGALAGLAALVVLSVAGVLAY
jgi:membrane protease YdiL (CAAX protease family)